MASKKQKDEVKQEKAPQKEQKASSGKKTATEKAGTEVGAEKKSHGEKTPTLAEQYKSLKEKHPDGLLLFRKGDFYQTLNEDAKKASDLLGITLTKPQDKAQGTHLAMFPHHALDNYLPKLVRAGVRVAIVDDISQNVQHKQASEVKADAAMQEQPKSETQKAEKAQREPREPQMVTVNGEKVSHAHAFQSSKNPEIWYFTAKIDGRQLRPMRMSAEDLAAYQKRESSVEQLMRTYYPSKLEPKVGKEEYAAANRLSDGRVIEKMNVYKEKDETKPDVGRYKLYAVVGEQKLSKTMSYADLNAYFDRVTTPARLVEKNFGEQLHLASAYEKYKLPEGAKVEDIRIAKDKQSNQWNISADLGKLGVTEKKPIKYDDGYSYFTAKTATREQLAAKYLSKEIRGLMAGRQQEQAAGLKL